MNLLKGEQLYCMNTFFKKTPQRKWTWRSPNGSVKNEIDYILTNNRHICSDVTVLNRFDTGSDHRLVRAKITINNRLERNKLAKKAKAPTKYERLVKQEQYQKELKKRLTHL